MAEIAWQIISDLERMELLIRSLISVVDEQDYLIHLVVGLLTLT